MDDEAATGREDMATAARKNTPKRYYATPDGERYPLYEAPYRYTITV
jgi:hypothetical protein